jgi:hypothetical protein
VISCGSCSIAKRTNSLRRALASCNAHACMMFSRSI